MFMCVSLNIISWIHTIIKSICHTGRAKNTLYIIFICNDKGTWNIYLINDVVIVVTERNKNSSERNKSLNEFSFLAWWERAEH